MHRFYVINDVYLCSASQLPGCTIGSDLLLPPAHFAEVMRKHSIEGVTSMFINKGESCLNEPVNHCTVHGFLQPKCW